MHQSNADRIRVLVADDDPIQRNLVGAHLAALNGAMVEAEDGVVAWDLLTSESFDMAIVDLSMPNLDGIALIECMRSHPRTRHLPIIVMTSRSDQKAIREAFAAGASSFFIKPIVWSTFEHLVGFLLRLVHAERRARADCQKSAALGRAKETLLRNLSDETTTTINEIQGEINQLIALWPGPPVPPSLVEKLDWINVQCVVLRDYTRRIDTAMQMLHDTIVVDSRNERLSRVVERVLAYIKPKADGAGVRIDMEAESRCLPFVRCRRDRTGADAFAGKCCRELAIWRSRDGFDCHPAGRRAGHRNNRSRRWNAPG